MGPIAATLLCYYEPEVRQQHCDTKFWAYPAQRVYAVLVQLHTRYNMHTIFAPGFPGLLEAIFVQERMTEKMMPAVWKVFVSPSTLSTIARN